MIKAFILDLDNTIYPVSSIGDKLFKPLHELLDKHRAEIGEDKLPEIKTLLMKKAWQKIAEQYRFSKELTGRGADILQNLTCDFPMQTFDEYSYIKAFKVDRFLVTMGFTRMQESKVTQLGLKSDFKEILINDPEKTQDTKKEVFEGILKKYNYQPREVLVMGDDPDSEIKAGLGLGMPTVLYDANDEYTEAKSTHHIKSYTELEAIINSYNDR